ncbi:MAG: hypothetical protein E7256_05740 [Lachnospiraceae bacterium]|nr:hypothetical protein [Lachnospiraceae bacterium]
MEIMITAVKEKVRRKELYIIGGIAVLLLFFLSSGESSLSINGKMITDFSMMLPVFMTIIHFVSCMLAIVLSIGTIGKEYERKTSHLIWIRGMSQLKYHGQLALSNLAVSLLAQAVFFAVLGIFCIGQGQTVCLMRIVPAYLMVGLSTGMISLLTSVLSIVLPEFAVGVISTSVLTGGVFHGLLEIAAGTVGGASGKVLNYMLSVVPDLNGNAKAASDFLMGGFLSIHLILKGLLVIYLISWFLLIFKKKEA